MKYLKITLLFLFTSHVLMAQDQYFTTSDSVKLYYKISGKGKPCLYLHGGPGSGSYWLEKLYGQELEKNFTMIYLDQRGVGRSSSAPNGDYSLQRIVKDFEELREHLAYEKWNTLGHSFGGILQVAYADAFPAVHQSMLLINCTLSMRDSFLNSWIPVGAELSGYKPELKENPTNGEILTQLFYIIPALDKKGLRWKMSHQIEANEIALNQLYNDIENWNGEYSAKVFNYDEYFTDFRPVAAQINIPMFVYYGTQDNMVGRAHFKDFKVKKGTIVAGKSGHMPFQENKTHLRQSINAFVKKYIK